MTRRGPSTALASLALLLAGLAIAPEANAQSMYRCGQANGTIRWSDRPCTDTAIRSYGPLPEAPPSTRYPRNERMPDALPYQSFLDVDCGELAEAVRTGRGRGLSYEGVDALRREYGNRCREQDNEARRRYQQSLDDENQRRADVRDSLQRAQADQQRFEEECGQMKRNLNARRARTDLTPGEQADLQRFEATYRDRCRR
ncbi:MAG: hypothetical protein ABW067_14095 [Rhizobacter sp.]